MLFAFGLRTISIKQPGRGVDSAALALRKASIAVEAGRAGTTEAADMGVLGAGTMNVMRYLKMLDGPITSYVHQGMTVGYVTDYFGNKTMDVIAPVTGVITLVCSVPTMKKDDNVVYIGEIGEDPQVGATH
jgi:predicted deacylase